MSRVIVNSTPLIALCQIGRLSLLKFIFDEVVVPTSVYNEVVVRGKNRPGAAELENADWIVVKAPQEKPSLSPMLLGLDQGEMDVILLAQELEADWVLVDEKLGRKVAEAVGLRVKGTSFSEREQRCHRAARAEFSESECPSCNVVQDSVG